MLLLAADVLPPQAALALWTVLAVLALADLALVPGARALDVALDAPAEVFAGEDVRLRVRVGARRGPVPPVAGARAEADDALGGLTRFALAPVAPDRADGAVTLHAGRRGLFRVAAVWLRWPSPLALWEVVARLPTDLALRVVPNIRPVVSGTIDAQVRSELYGVKDTVSRGEGSEFHQLVEFTTGMDTRAIDWKHSARHRALVAKEMRAERNHQIILALDNGYLMRGEVAGLARIDHAINAALAMTWAAGLGGDLVGLYSFDAEPRRYIPPQPGRAAFPALRSQLAEMGYSSVESNHTLALAHLNARLKRRSLIVIFSDFADTTTAELLVENLQVLNRAHVIVFVTLRDPELETRQDAMPDSADAVAEAVVAADMARERQLVLDRLARLGILCLETAPNTLTARLLSTYLEIKARELI
ncbi:DUF58 domain-containing protein [Rhodobacteraceae bacterium 2CG4]|uniref:DUF58 domain-containing protein n=1 Tax=Halovulum marinum TaxID=2662447 RepID=A0A6L5YVM1_9RHOB|nr:DUF58 domain-containing protein [Halovulum marinum]